VGNPEEAVLKRWLKPELGKKAERQREPLRPSGTSEFSDRGFHIRYFAFIFFLIRRSSIKQSPEVVQRTQPIMIITFMSIGAGSSPACVLRLLQTYTATETTLLGKDTAKGLCLLLPF
jgi:hypothetical protein